MGLKRCIIIASLGLVVILFIVFTPKNLLHTHGMDLLPAEKTRLENEATSGDPKAALRLYDYFAYERHDEMAAQPWLRRAAELGDPKAQRKLAELIKLFGFPPGDFGKDAPSAVLALLEPASKNSGSACYGLASAYAEGYFGTPDPEKARAFYRQGALLNSRMCWKKLSECYRQGLGGPRDDQEAYYWISLEARCIDPRSYSGKETWSARNEISSLLSLPELERQWKRIDEFMSQVDAGKIIVDFPPFGRGYFDSKTVEEGSPLAQKKEDDHRKQLRDRG